MSTANYFITPADGWVKIASAGATFTRVSNWPHTHPYYLYAGSAPPATLTGGVLTVNKPYWNDTLSPDNLYARVQNFVSGAASNAGALRLDVITEDATSGTNTVTPFTNSAAGTSSSFVLTGGLYQLSVTATFGSLIMNQLGADGTTWVSVSLAQTSNGGQTLFLPPGTYQLVSTGGSAYYAKVTRIP